MKTDKIHCVFQNANGYTWVDSFERKDCPWITKAYLTPKNLFCHLEGGNLALKKMRNRCLEILLEAKWMAEYSSTFLPKELQRKFKKAKRGG